MVVLGGSHTGVEHEIAAFQKRVLDRVLLLCLVALLANLATTPQLDLQQRASLGQLAMLPAALLVGVAALWSTAPARLRQLALIIGILAPTLSIGYRTAFLTPNAFTGHMMLVVLVALVVGRRAAWAVLGLILALWLAIALHFTGGAAVPVATVFDPRQPLNWFRVLLVFGLVTSTCVAAVTYLMNKTHRAIHRVEALNAALTEESAARISALEAQRRLEDDLRQARKLEALGTLAGGVAHDFNNLLMVISCHAELASGEPLSAAGQESLQEIRAASERASALTRQLLAFGRRQVSTRGPVQLDQVVTETLRMLRCLLPSSIELELHAAAESGTVWSDAVELSQVVMNLCVNARDAMPAGGRLTVRTEALWHTPAQGEPGRFVHLAICDNGLGMDAATLERAFEPFFTTKGSGAGTGLGLSTVHGIVQQLGGHTQIESQPRHGTTVHVWLPQCSAHTSTPELAAPARLSGHETILVVDDDRGAREVHARVLRQAGYQVLTCDNGRQAWELYQARSQEIALIVSDAIMPQMGGRELHQHVSARFGEVPFLVCSGYTNETFASDFFEQPLRAFLAKPYAVSELLRRVRGLLDASAAARTPSATSARAPLSELQGAASTLLLQRSRRELS